ncbi:uncharacterized protein EDB91DRAFT_1093430 [Suillus paluster]|uniref:uncharacterized protein n=1 Tax=Suillus paluster TaxID=48578 RepID=UPI001B87060B|nr:uncharacterized protein EDB91DRAFT_1093430 [Suillus paluster]KAG1756577.1 hypothetical protein EDB91DRAFT_1093430 [Suillus paluster]
MPNLMSTVIDGHDVLATNDHILGHHDSHTNDADIHDLSIPGAHFHNSIASSIPVSINGSHNVYYNSYADSSCASYPDIGPYPYPLQQGHVPDTQLDLQYILTSDMSHSHSNDFVHDHSQLQTKQFHQSQDISSIGPPSDPEAQSSPSISSSASFAHALHDLSRSPDNAQTPYTCPSSPPKVARYAHAMLPPIVHSSPSNARKDETDSRSINKRLNAGSASQVDPYASAFLRDQLGEAKWNTFYARLFERRLGPIKSKMRVKSNKGTGGGELTTSSPGATAIDFLIKVEVVKEVLRTYVPHPYNPLKSLTHPFQGSPSGSVTLTRSTILALSGWSNTQFSYWARRSEGISVLRDHDERLHAVAVALEKRLRQGGVLQDLPEDDTLSSLTYGHVAESSPNVTGKGLDIIVEDVKKRTGLSPFLRGKHSSLDPFGSTNGDKDTGPGPPSGPPSGPVYMPTFQAMEYSHSPPVSTEPPRRPKKKRRTSAAESISSHAGSSVAHTELVAGPGQLGYAMESDIKSDIVHAMSPDAASPASLSASRPLPRSLGTSVMDDAIGAYQLPLQSSMMDDVVENANREYFPVSDSRSDLDGLRHKRPFLYSDLSMETRQRLSV